MTGLLMPVARRGARVAGQVLLSSGIALGVLSAVLLLGGFPLGASLSALGRGAFGSVDAILSATLVRATPLLLMGTGMVVALRAGVINLGGDGQLLAGAVAATTIALRDTPGIELATALVALLAAAAAGAAWTAVPAWLKARFDTLEVVSTIMMNFVAVYLVSYLVRGPLQEPSGIYPQSGTVPDSMHLPLLVEGSRLHAGVLVAVAVTVAGWLVLERTHAGFRIRASGSSPRAAALAGRIDVQRVRGAAFLLSGALAGLAGGVEVLGVTYAVYENLSPGYGYTAIAVALLARLRPLHVFWSALLLGGLAAGSMTMQRDAGIPAGAAATVEATLILVILASQFLPGRRPLWSRSPAARRSTGAA